MPRADNLTTLIYRLSRDFGNLNPLDLKGPDQACNGIALLLPFFFTCIN